LQEGVIDVSKPHHLLGCELPLELIYYRGGSYSFIKSVDSSSPIVHGLLGIQYTNFGLWEKKSIKLADLMEYPEDKISENYACIEYNIRKFREFATT